ncbi:hypothetical protein RHMOL_Rhmol08G0177000 [Rhododendron molle]|uniref:Uncharacterized protein n=1 Tax=Rhododendron molle TaxID=49168 RepID=A0ACC0MQR4_RHOML|nr:hypothetical protein RHMOL_Rhmol08G0177000 [Rhododendron molle]
MGGSKETTTDITVVPPPPPDLELISKYSIAVLHWTRTDNRCAAPLLASKVDAIKDSLENDKEKLERALSFPLKLIAKNDGDNGSINSDKVPSNDNPKFGYNAATGEYEDLMATKIIDPTKVSFRDK